MERGWLLHRQQAAITESGSKLHALHDASRTDMPQSLFPQLQFVVVLSHHLVECCAVRVKSFSRLANFHPPP